MIDKKEHTMDELQEMVDQIHSDATVEIMDWLNSFCSKMNDGDRPQAVIINGAVSALARIAGTVRAETVPDPSAMLVDEDPVVQTVRSALKKSLDRINKSRKVENLN